MRSVFMKDRVLKFLSLGVIVSALIVFYRFKDELDRRTQLSADYPCLSDLRSCGLYGALFVAVQWCFRLAMIPVGRTFIPRKPVWSREVWVAKVDRFTAAIYKLLVTLFGLVYLYLIIHKANWYPTALGGTGSTANCWLDGFPFQPVDLDLKKFMLASVAFVVSDLFVILLKERRRPDFSELVLHLLGTVSLLVFAYLANFIRIVSLVIMTHLICDVFVYSAKALVDTRLSGGALAYFPLLTVHVWFRLNVFSSTVLKSVLVEAPKVLAQESRLAWAYISVMLCLSLLLHAYWGFVIVKIGLLLLTTGQSRDLQANLSAMDIRDEKNGSSILKKKN